jgi:hypothetical protein
MPEVVLLYTSVKCSSNYFLEIVNFELHSPFQDIKAIRERNSEA